MKKSAADQLALEVEQEASDADESSVLDPRVVAALRASGLGEHMVPKRFGGRSERIDPFAVCLIREAFMARSAHLDAEFSMQGIGSYALQTAAHPSVQERWLPGIAALDVVPGLALTEPEVGSDLKNVSTRVEQHGDVLVLSGRKSYISNGGFAHVYTVFA